MQHTLKLISISFIIFLAVSNAYAFGKGKILQPQDLAAVAQKMDSYIYQHALTVLQDIDTGKVAKNSPKATIGFFQIVNDGLNQFGFSMDDTFRTVISQRDLSFWSTTFHRVGYGNLLGVVFQGMQNTDVRRMLLSEKMISSKTDKAWDKYVAWMTQIEGQ